MEEQITLELLKAVVMIATIVIVRYLVPMLIENANNIQDARLRAFVKEAVHCAEQTLETGTDKKEFVANLIIAWLKSQSIKADEKQIETLIESAVYEMNEAMKQKQDSDSTRE